MDEQHGMYMLSFMVGLAVGVWITAMFCSWIASKKDKKPSVEVETAIDEEAIPEKPKMSRKRKPKPKAI